MYAELSMHNHFIELRGKFVLGRSAEISTVMEFVQDETLSDGCNTEDLPPLIVLASSGSGKSALMAHCTLEIKKVGKHDGINRMHVLSKLCFLSFCKSFIILFWCKYIASYFNPISHA